jgi:Sporulation and spore germination
VTGAASRRAFALLALCLVAAAACGVGVDGAPRHLAVASTTTTTVAAPSPGGVESILYYVHDGALIPSSSELPDRELATVLTALLQPPPSSLAAGGSVSSIPAGTELLGVFRAEGRVTINLSAAFDNVIGPSRQQAIGQMVMTTTQRNEYDTVEFQIDGKAIQVSSLTRGDTPVVTACDFAPLLATAAEADDAQLSGEMADVLLERRTTLRDTC